MVVIVIIITKIFITQKTPLAKNLNCNHSSPPLVNLLILSYNIIRYAYIIGEFMQFRKLFDFKNISRFITLAIVIFLFLPLIFPEKNDFKIIKKESVYSREDSPLPIFQKESILDKYVNKLKKFYKMDVPVFDTSKQESESTPIEDILIAENYPAAKTQAGIEPETKNNNKDVDITAQDLFFSADLYDKENDTYNTNPSSEQIKEDNSVNLQKGTVLTQDGMLLEPTQEGYYYKGKFYKNGTYPPNANKKRIEGALTRYHSRVAKNLGKKALYFADEHGNLTVSYVSELPNEASTDIETYLAQNRTQTQNTDNSKNSSYNNNLNNQNDMYKNYGIDNIADINNSDIALASIKSMHAAYNLANTKIKAGQMGQEINFNEPYQNAFINVFLNNNNTASNEIIPNKPNNPPLPPVNPENGETIVAGDQNFAQDYADKIHELHCGSDNTNDTEPSLTPFVIGNASQSNEGSISVSCDIAPVIIETSSAIYGNVSENSDFQKFTNELNKITNQSEKTDINIISTDRNFYPVAAALNNEESIRNSNDEPVTVHIIGPNEEEADLSKVLEGVTYSITDDVPAADKLNDDLADYYASLQDENTDTHTILAFPTEDETKVFVLADPNNSYWLKNPKQLKNAPAQYMEKNGVYYKGIIIDKTQIGDLVNAEKTNLLYISDQNYTHYLPNGSALTTVKEEDVKINSLHPEQIQKNTERVRDLTQKGQETLQKNQKKEQQTIEVIDLEKGNKKIQPQK